MKPYHPRPVRSGRSYRRRRPASGTHAERQKLQPGADARLKKVFSRIGVPSRRTFTPDRFQLEALSAIAMADCLVTAPTGAGKTWIAEEAIARVLEGGGRSWYASPLKALTNSKLAEFSRRFGSQRVGILTGDRKENPEAPIIVGTTEILRNQLYDAMHRGTMLATDFVVLDEAHFLGDEERGVVWEETMIYLPQRIPLLMLSATIGNAGQIARWLESIRHRRCSVVIEEKRPVPLYHLFMNPSGTLLPLVAQSSVDLKPRLDKKVSQWLGAKKPMSLICPGRMPPFGEILGVLKAYDLLPAIFFMKSRADCDQALKFCLENLIHDEMRLARLKQRVAALLTDQPHIAHHRQRWQLEHLAVGAHHSGQLPSWKLLLETLMTEGLLDAVFATSTVAAGVNFPARTVVFLNSDRFNGREFAPLSPTEFHQMTGRSGRRGMDHIGFTLAVPDKYLDLRHIVRLIASPPTDVLSQIRINFSMTLNLLLSHRPEEIEALLASSFAAYLLSHKGRKAVDTGRREQARGHLYQDFLRHLEFLKATGFAQPDDRLTEDGIWASQLRIDQPLLVAEGLRLGLFPSADPAQLAALMASLVYDKESDERLEGRQLPNRLRKVLVRMQKGLLAFSRHLHLSGFATRPLFTRPAAIVFAWTSGHAWDAVCRDHGFAEGDLAMLVLRTADHLRHLASLETVFPATAATALQAIALLLRDPVIPEGSPPSA
jgi:ATP-dependent RNA helicase HelY